MPNINDRIGSQNVIRVLSNASAPPSRLVNLTDVNSALKAKDGLLLVWNASDEVFYMTDTIDSSTLTISGIVTFSNTAQSTSTTTGTVIVSGGVGVAKNLNDTADKKIYLNLNSFKGEKYSYKSIDRPVIDYVFGEGDRIRFISNSNGPVDE